MVKINDVLAGKMMMCTDHPLGKKSDKMPIPKTLKRKMVV